MFWSSEIEISQENIGAGLRETNLVQKLKKPFGQFLFRPSGIIQLRVLSKKALSSPDAHL